MSKVAPHCWVQLGGVLSKLPGARTAMSARTDGGPKARISIKPETRGLSGPRSRRVSMVWATRP